MARALRFVVALTIALAPVVGACRSGRSSHSASAVLVPPAGEASSGDAAAVAEGLGARIGVAVGGQHSCALDGAGHVSCWGQNAMGQLGGARGREEDCQEEDFQTEVEFPGRCSGAQRVEGIDAARQIALGNEHSCALREDGSVMCWGSHWFGALGIGEASDRCPTEACARTPSLVRGLRARSIAAGGDVTCAVTDEGRVACWGQGMLGQMGTLAGLDKCTVTREPCSRTPREIGGIDRAVQLAVGAWHVCALRDDGTVWCWGGDDFGQLGVGDAPMSKCRDAPCAPGPTAVPGVQAVEIAAGAFHTCALLRDGSVACWGRDDLGDLGGPPAPDACKLWPGTVPCSRTPRRIAGMPRVKHLASGATCAIGDDGGARCWGSDIYHQLDASSPAPHTCKSNGENDVPCARIPVSVRAAGTVRDIATNGALICATHQDGSVLCWGANGAGQAGPPEKPPTLCEFLPGQKEPCVALPRRVL